MNTSEPSGAALSALETQAATTRDQIKITAIKAMQTTTGTRIKIETDAGITGYGPCGGSGPFARAVIAGLEGPRLPHLGLIGKDPLAIGVHYQQYVLRLPAKRARGRRPERYRHCPVGSGRQNPGAAGLQTAGR